MTVQRPLTPPSKHPQTHPPNVLLHDIHRVLILQVVPQAVRCQDEKPIGRLQLPDGDGRPGGHVGGVERVGASEAGEERRGVELEELHVAVPEGSGDLHVESVRGISVG